MKEMKRRISMKENWKAAENVAGESTAAKS